MIYLDTSALLKLLFEERESAALAAWLGAHAEASPVTSALSRIEVTRAVRRLDAGVLPAARVLLQQLDLVPLTGPVLDRAADLADPLLRGLDALHLASALSLAPDVTPLVAYDARLLRAAEAEGLAVAHPGA